MGIASKLQSGPPAQPSAGQPAQSYGQPGQYGQNYGQPYGQPAQNYGQPAQSYGQPAQNSMYPTIGPAAAYPSMGPPGGQYPSLAPTNQYPSTGSAGYNPGYGAPQAPTGFSVQEIRAKLENMVNENRLRHFYPPQRLDQLAQEVSRMDVLGLGQRWRLPKEVNFDLITLALYDIVIWADDSTSMEALDKGERIRDLEAILGRVADAATLFDTDGISIRFFNSKKEFDNLRNANDVKSAIKQVQFDGYTPLGSGLEAKCIIPYVITPARNNFLKKPVLFITITDGEPTGPGEQRQSTRNAIVRAHQYLATLPYGTGACAFMFAQVGKDENATKFLGELDVDPVIGASVDCVSDYELEEVEYSKKGIQLTPEVYLVKLMVGAVDRSYDEQDEG